MNGVSATPMPIMRQREQHHAAHAEPVHQRGDERAGGAVEQDVDADRKRDVARDQPNSFSSGTTRMPGVERTPAATSIVPNATAATIQA